MPTSKSDLLAPAGGKGLEVKFDVRIKPALKRRLSGWPNPLVHHRTLLGGRKGRRRRAQSQVAEKAGFRLPFWHRSAL